MVAWRIAVQRTVACASEGGPRHVRRAARDEVTRHPPTCASEFRGRESKTWNWKWKCPLIRRITAFSLNTIVVDRFVARLNFAKSRPACKCGGGWDHEDRRERESGRNG